MSTYNVHTACGTIGCMSETDLVLYRFFNANGDLLYVGRSTVIGSRLQAHRNTSEFYPQVAKITLQRGFGSLMELNQAETAAIIAESPKYNVSLTPAPSAPYNRAINSASHYTTMINGRQAAALANVHENTIRNWADKGILNPIRVGPSGVRRYDAAEVKRVTDSGADFMQGLGVDPV